jgi:Holliday junction resolvase RusA-like endonuclease
MPDVITTTERRLLTVRVNGAPCTNNRRYARRRSSAYGAPPKRGDVYLTKAAREWQAAVAAEAWLQLTLLQLQHEHLPLAPAELRVSCTFLGVLGDADNYLKATLDGLAEGLQINDRYFNPVQAARKRGPRGAQKGAVIEIYEVAA